MKLYQTGATPSCRRVSIFLKELGVEVPRVEINVREGDNLTDEFLARSVNGKVPMLELATGETLCESVAICRYFDASYPNDLHLFGANPLAKAEVEMWHRVVEFQGLYTAFQAFRNITGFYADREHCVEEWGHESKKRVNEFLPVLEKQLSQHDFVAGNAFTIVDITAFLFIGFCINGLKIEVLENYAAIRLWFEEMSKRPSFN